MIIIMLKLRFQIKGWVFVKTNGYGGRVPFYSKWGELEDMPQRVMDTAYNYLVWAKEA